MSNELLQEDGRYNPDYIEWLDGNLSKILLELSKIFLYDIKDGEIQSVDLATTAVDVFTVQYYGREVSDALRTLIPVIEVYNSLMLYLEEKGIGEDFRDYHYKIGKYEQR